MSVRAGTEILKVGGFSRRWNSACLIQSDIAPPPKSDSNACLNFRICCYNMLAQSLLNANGELYVHCPPEYLKWEYRKWRLLRELLDSQATILCLQEVDEEVYHSWLYPQLRSKGFIGVYKKRTGLREDGCVICVQASIFRIEQCVEVEYQKKCSVLNRDNVAIVLIVRSVSHPQHVFCIATTHIIFNPKAGEVKLAQISLLLAEIHRATTKPGSDYEGCPVVLCGDFNMMPLCPLYHFMVDSGLDYTHVSAHQATGHGGWSTARRIPFPLFPPKLGIGNGSVYAQNLPSIQNQKSEVSYSNAKKICPAKPNVGSSIPPPCHQPLIHPDSQRNSHALKDTEPIPSLQLGLPIPVVNPRSCPGPSNSLSDTQLDFNRTQNYAKDRSRVVDMSASTINPYSVPGSQPCMRGTYKEQSYGRPPFSSRVPPPLESATNLQSHPLYNPATGQLSIQGANRYPVAPLPRPLLPTSTVPQNRMSAVSYFPPNQPAPTYHTPLPTRRPPQNPAHTFPHQPPQQTREDCPPSQQNGSGLTARETTSHAKLHLVTHPFQLASVYPHADMTGPQPRSVTTYHCSACENTDYIFYTPVNLCPDQSRLVLTERLALPSTRAFLDSGPMPNKYQSSDHIMICASFALLPPHSQQ